MNLSRYRKEFLLFLLVGVAIVIIAVVFGDAYAVRMLAEAACYAILALGLSLQWGYAGLFNAGGMGFVGVGAFIAMLFAFPVNDAFWESDSAAALGGFLLEASLMVLAVIGLTQVHRIGIRGKLKGVIVLTGLIVAFFLFNHQLLPVAKLIESEAGFIGGFGLPVLVGWVAGGLAAAVVAYWVGKACLGLRADYLAIATLGIAEIIKAILKNADWLTRGTLTVSPLPWPVPTPNDIGFIAARSAYLALTAVLVAIIFVLLQRAYRAPWGRMMRAIRDNEVSAAAMGKDINFRRLQVFVLGSGLIGFGGAALISFARIFDPSSFTPLKHTFLVWVMVLVGGAGNNLGAIFGAVAVYIIWLMGEPITLFLFESVRELGSQWFDWEAPDDLISRALQARVFFIGLTITLVLRFVPNGLIPERIDKVS